MCWHLTVLFLSFFLSLFLRKKKLTCESKSWSFWSTLCFVQIKVLFFSDRDKNWQLVQTKKDSRRRKGRSFIWWNGPDPSELSIMLYCFMASWLQSCLTTFFCSVCVSLIAVLLSAPLVYHDIASLSPLLAPFTPLFQTIIDSASSNLTPSRHLDVHKSFRLWVSIPENGSVRSLPPMLVENAARLSLSLEPASANLNMVHVVMGNKSVKYQKQVRFCKPLFFWPFRRKESWKAFSVHKLMMFCRRCDNFLKKIP